MRRVLVLLVVLGLGCQGTPISLGEYIAPDSGLLAADAELAIDSGSIDAGITLPQVTITPTNYDFGPSLINCRRAGHIEVVSAGPEFNTITRLSIEGPSNFDIENINLPKTLIPNELLKIEIGFTPSSINSTISAIVRIEYSSPQTMDTIDAVLSGYGVVTRTQTDNFTQKVAPEIDFLFVIDRSCSMGDEFATLNSQLNKLDTYLQSNLVDFHIGLTDMDTQPTGNQGRLLGEPKVIEIQTPNYTQVLRNQLRPQTGTGFIEAGIEASILALTEPLISTDNAGFLRTTSALSILYMTDEADQSPQLISVYEEQLRALRPRGMLDLRAIVRVAPNGSLPCSAQYGQGYVELVTAFGGQLGEICEQDWDSVLSDFPHNFGLNTQFELRYPAENSGLKVEISGDKESMVTLSPDRTHIVFTSSATPDRSSNIFVEYQTKSCQDVSGN
jgi:hypothetical protein